MESNGMGYFERYVVKIYDVDRLSLGFNWLTFLWWKELATTTRIYVCVLCIA